MKIANQTARNSLCPLELLDPNSQVWANFPSGNRENVNFRGPKIPNISEEFFGFGLIWK